MCAFDQPSAPKPPPPPPPPPQASKAPEPETFKRKNQKGTNSAMGGEGTLLTGPSGIDNAQLNLGKNTLLGE